MKFLILKNSRSKEVRKMVENLKKEQKGKERHLHNNFHMFFFFKKKKGRKTVRDGLMQQMSAAEINDN